MAKQEPTATYKSLAYRKYLRFVLDSEKKEKIFRGKEMVSKAGSAEGDEQTKFVMGKAVPRYVIGNAGVDNRPRSPETQRDTENAVLSDLASSEYCCDVKQRLSVGVTSLDNTQEVVFPNVRHLVRQFNEIIQSDTKGKSYEHSELVARESFRQFSYGRQINDIVGHLETMSDMKRRIQAAEIPKFTQQRVDVSKEHGCPYFSSVVNIVHDSSKIRDSSVHLTVTNRSGLKWRSNSDSYLGINSFQKGLYSRRDSGTSDLSDDVGVVARSWSGGSLNDQESSVFRESETQESLSPAAVSSCESVDNIRTIMRSVSCDMSFNQFGPWDRSNSSDSAVVIDDDSLRYCPASPPTVSRKLTNHLPPTTVVVAVDKNTDESGFPAKESDGQYESEEVVFRRPKQHRQQQSDAGVVGALKRPSVVISDHSSGNVCVHVAYAADDFSVNNMLAASNTEAFSEGYICPRKVSECSTCSSVSTVDLCLQGTAPLEICPEEILQRRLSDSSTCSYLTGSEDEVEVTLQQPSPQPHRKSSNWRKVRNVVQWTPFIQTYKRHKYPWVQLAGHQGNFKAGYRQGTIMKKLCPAEAQAFQAISNDVLRTFVPECIGVVEGSDGENYLQLQDLLSDFSSPCVMDMKMGVRTYLEEELAKARIKPKLRKDMYDKMIQIDVKAPTEAEHRAKAVTKPRYMVWRETISSTATLGFRIEGVRQGDGTSSKDFKTTRTRDQVLKALAGFTEGYPQIVIGYVRRLKEIRAALENSKFFKSHELIGSSLLFVHNEDKHGIWLIDFAKTIPLPDAVKTSHNVPWSEGTHEDGYLIGLDNLIDLFEHIQESPPSLGQENIVAKEERLSGSAVEVVGDGETSSDISSSHSYEKNPSSEVDTNDIPLEVNQNNRPKNPVTTEGKKIVPLESVTQSLQSDKVPGSSVTPQRVSNVIRNEPSQKAGKKAD